MRRGSLYQRKPAFSGFRASLIDLTGEDPGAAAQAHHIFPVKYGPQFAGSGVDINLPQYGAWWPTASHQANAAAYNQMWGQFLATNPGRDEILDFGRGLADRYGLKVGF